MTESPKLVTIVFALSVSLLILLSIFSYQQIKEADFYTERVDHTYEVIASTNKVMESLKGMIAYERGILLTHDKEFRGLFQNEKDTLWQSFNSLKKLTSDNPVQFQRISPLEELLQRRVAVINEELRYDSINAMNEHKELIIKGKDVSIEIKSLIEKIKREELQLMISRRSEREKSQSLTPMYIFIIDCIAFILLVLSFYFLTRELVKRIRIEKELQFKITDLNRSNSELEQFAYVASHDLQEPLRKIRIFISQLIHKYKSLIDEDGQVMFDKTENAAHRMQLLIEDLLNFSKTVKTTDIEKTPVNLNNILTSVLNDFSETITAKNAHVQVGELPGITAYPSQMTQLFQNLIGNALKFSKPDTPPVINISYHNIKGKEIEGIDKSRMLTDFYKITIEDNGIGFDEKYKEKIFVIFQRLHTNSQFVGTGIGLAICKRVVSNHNGMITVSSTLGKGTTFSVYLPVD
jgi:signal transduction histidine kinase